MKFDAPIDHFPVWHITCGPYPGVVEVRLCSWRDADADADRVTLPERIPRGTSKLLMSGVK